MDTHKKDKELGNTIEIGGFYAIIGKDLRECNVTAVEG
jgi:hypothetical protein